MDVRERRMIPFNKAVVRLSDCVRASLRNKGKPSILVFCLIFLFACSILLVSYAQAGNYSNPKSPSGGINDGRYQPGTPQGRPGGGVYHPSPPSRPYPKMPPYVLPKGRKRSTGGGGGGCTPDFGVGPCSVPCCNKTSVQIPDGTGNCYCSP